MKILYFYSGETKIFNEQLIRKENEICYLMNDASKKTSAIKEGKRFF